jgi:hypothetical protein
MQYHFTVSEDKLSNFSEVGSKEYQLYEVLSSSTDICYAL